MTQRIGGVGAIVLALALVAGACSDSGAAPEEPAQVAPTTTSSPQLTTTTTTPPATTTTTEPGPTLVVWSDPERAAALNTIGQAFTRDTGVAVEVVAKDYATIKADAEQQIAVGDGPDLFVGDHDWTGSLARAGLVTRIDDIPSPTRSQFYDTAFQAFMYDGATYGLPFEFEAVALWMNTTLAGTDEAPTDFEAVRAVCDLVVDEDEGQICLAVSGGADAPNAYHQFPFTSAFGGTIFSYDPSDGYRATTAGIDSDESILGNSFMRRLSTEEYMPSLNYLSAQNRFAEGKSVFWLTGPWAAGPIFDGAAAAGFEYQAVPIPTMADNAAKPFVEARGLFLSASSVLESEAKRFLYRYVARPDSVASLLDRGTSLPTHESVAATLAPNLQVFVTSAAEGQPTPNIPEMTSDVWDVWGSALTDIRNGTNGVEDSLKAAAQTINVMLGL